MTVVYLDQNKWVDVARAIVWPDKHPRLHAVLTKLQPRIDAGEIVFPLSMSTLFETYKVNDPQRRHRMAMVQASFSGGRVFRGRHARLEQEAGAVFRGSAGMPAAKPAIRWFLSDVFLEAFSDIGDPRLEGVISSTLVEAVQSEPARHTYDWLMEAGPSHRARGVRMFSDGAEALRVRIEKRRELWAGQSFSDRKRAHGALILIEEMDLFLAIANRAGLNWKTISDMGAKTAKALIREAPTLNTERELSLRLESQNRAINENDMRDMKAYCAAVPYADVIIGENQFINLARQGGLDKLYGTQLAAHILTLESLT